MTVYKDGKYEVPMSGFFVLGVGWGGVPFTSQKFAHSTPPKKIPPIRHPPPKVNPLPPLNNNFQVMTQQKQHF